MTKPRENMVNRLNLLNLDGETIYDILAEVCITAVARNPISVSYEVTAPFITVIPSASSYRDVGYTTFPLVVLLSAT